MGLFRSGTALGLAVSIATSLPVQAGAFYSEPVVVRLSSTAAPAYAEGALLAARFAENGAEYIGCQVYNSAETPSLGIALCAARDRYGDTLQCTSTHPELIAQASALDAAGFLAFEADSDGTCHSMQVRYSSTNLE